MEPSGAGLPRPGTLQHTVTLGVFRLQQVSLLSLSFLFLFLIITPCLHPGSEPAGGQAVSARVPAGGRCLPGDRPARRAGQAWSGCGLQPCFSGNENLKSYFSSDPKRLKGIYFLNCFFIRAMFRQFSENMTI